MRELKFSRKRKGTSGTSGRRSSRRSDLRFESERGKHHKGGYGQPRRVNIAGLLCWIGEIILVCAAAVFLVLAFGYRVSNTGESMEPALDNGEVVLVNRLSYRMFSPARGDIVAYSQDGSEQYSVKRIVGLPGETIQIVEGSIFIDGEQLTEDVYAEDISYAGLASAPVELGDGEYFVIGDNASASDDSRSPDAGPVSEDEIYGKVWFVASFGDHFVGGEEMHFQWYPGHMTKARRMMQENIKLIDLIIELVDARIPLSSRNPDIDEMGKNKARLIVLNKADLAEEKRNDEWVEFFKEKGYSAVKVNSKKGGGIKSIQSVIQEACREKTERDRRRGILNRPVRAMVAGIPNVGKSTFINTLAGKACTKTGNKPGVTKGKQWIRLNKSVELLDTPGILWPKFEDQTAALKLAFIGSIKDEILQTEELAAELIRFLEKEYAGVIGRKYSVEPAEDPYECLRRIAESRHCLVRGSELDTEKASALLLDDFRNGRLGRITLENPGDITGK